MDVQKVDLANWPRREFWNHYMNEVRCTYAMTAELDASRLLPALKRRGLKLYPALIHMLSQVVHRHEEFRYNTGADGEPVQFGVGRTYVNIVGGSSAVTVGEACMEVTHTYEDAVVHLTLFHAAIAAGRPRLLEHTDMRWITPAEIPHYPFCPADAEILEKLQTGGVRPPAL